MKPLIAAALYAFVACTPGTSFTGPATLVADQTSVRVGESSTLELSIAYAAVGSIPDVQSAALHAYIFSSADPEASPYLPDTQGGLKPEGDPANFPVDPAVEVISPSTGSNNVAQLVGATQQGDRLKAVFVVKGRQQGTARIRGGFLVEFKSKEKGWVRVPLFPSALGTTNINVSP